MTDAIRPIGEDDVDDLQRLLEACTAYAEQVTGYPTGPSDALSTLLQLPEGRGPEDKSVLGGWQAGRLIACADLILRHPEDRTTTLGLLLVRPEERRRGHGRRMHDAALRIARRAGAVRIRLGVVDTARGSEPFWAALGYAPEGDASPYRYDKLHSTVRHWTRGIAPS